MNHDEARAWGIDQTLRGETVEVLRLSIEEPADTYRVETSGLTVSSGWRQP
jgi:hypothetical protein